MFNLYNSAYVREYKTILDSGFHAVDSGSQVLDSAALVSGSGILDTSC